ncbi:DUF4446 family protein [Patescibacteria group bacterium]|nr:DUF4446 family protein [Patescibacteria group bacterium]MBU4367838.1 DUF4446 family protein [Patescibacteria group bacterium]MBU4462026.1 DUF4446 family protein [Patescibacteria group bacterium]MCG2700260.1 DUF4446 family protein [Candidatus Parcubacteria bacterium]
MPYIDTSFIVLSGVVLALIAVNIYFTVCLFKFRKKITLLLEGKKIKNLEDVILNQLQKTKKQEADIADLTSKIKKLENISEKTFQKIGMLRFNPFNDMGGNQSFVIALLDNQNNGFVISSLFIKEGNRVYAKSIKSGQSNYPLSDEEKEALDRAMNVK